MIATGIKKGPKFERIKIETVGLPWHEKVLKAFSRPRIRLTEDYVVSMPEYDIVLPNRFESDGGSIPVFLLWAFAVLGIYLGGWWTVAGMGLMLLGLLLNPFGLMLVAFLVHDYAVKYGRLKTRYHGNPGHRHLSNVGEANKIMRMVNFRINGMIALGWAAHIGVTIGAWIAWN